MEKDIEKEYKTIIAEIEKKIKREENEEKKNKKIEKVEEKNIICPHCSTIITIEYEPSQRIEIDCPICGNKGITPLETEKKTYEKQVTERTNIQNEQENKHADKIETYTPKIQSFVWSKIIGLTLITVGIIFLYNPTIPNIKISFTSILMGSIMIFILPEKSSFNRIRLPITYTITLALLIWTIFLFFITGDTDLEVFFVLILIGMLIVKELTDEFTTKRLKHRIDGFIFIFLLAFIWIIGEKIINVLNM